MILICANSESQCVRQVLNEIFDLYKNDKAISVLYINSTTPDLLSINFSNTPMSEDEEFMRRFQYEKMVNIQDMNTALDILHIWPTVVVVEDVLMLIKGSNNSYLENSADLVKLFRVLKQMELENGTVTFLLNEYNRFLELNCTQTINASV